MQESLSDIESLVLQCNSDSSKDYIAEAIKCYKAGAYRSTIVSTWIAIVFDLIDKVRELALSGDGKAKALYDKYEKYIEEIEKGNQVGVTKALEFERNIIDSCKNDLGFFDQQQLTDLVRIKEDRHRCAHPSFQELGTPFKPSAELARLHIRNAIVHVLAKPPIQGKSAIANIVKQIESEYFPIDEDKALEVLKKAGLNRPSDSLIRNLIDKLTFGFLSKDDTIYQHRPIIRVINILHDQYPAIVEERLKKQLNKILHEVPDELLKWAVSLVVKIRVAWPLLDKVSKEKISIFIERGPNKTVITGLNIFYTFDDLKEVVTAKINTLDVTDLSKVIEAKRITPIVKERAFILLSESRSYDESNKVISKLIMPLFDNLDDTDLTRIVKMPETHDADLIGANGMETLIERARSKKLMSNKKIDKILVKNGFKYLLSQ